MGLFDKLFGSKTSDNKAGAIKTNSAIDAPSEQRISKLESYYHFRFPEKYLGFLRENNGGIPDVNAVTVNGHPLVIERFLPISENPKTCDIGEYDIAVVLSQIEERLTDNPDLVGCDVIPIAALFAGNYLCLDFRENANEPTVCVWEHETSEEFSPDIYEVASNFGAFLAAILKQ